MRRWMILFLLPLLAFIGPAEFSAHVDLQPGQQYTLGGGQSEPFNVRVENKGGWEVQLYLRTEVGNEQSAGRVKPGGSAKTKVGPQTVFIIRNQADNPASLEVSSKDMP